MAAVCSAGPSIHNCCRQTQHLYPWKLQTFLRDPDHPRAKTHLLPCPEPLPRCFPKKHCETLSILFDGFPHIAVLRIQSAVRATVQRLTFNDGSLPIYRLEQRNMEADKARIRY
jgi:hypothetical protein